MVDALSYPPVTRTLQFLDADLPLMGDVLAAGAAEMRRKYEALVELYDRLERQQAQPFPPPRGWTDKGIGYDPNLGVIDGVRLSLSDIGRLRDQALEAARRAELLRTVTVQGGVALVCTHPEELRIKGGYDGQTLPRMPLRFGSAEVDACHGCGRWHMPVHAPNEWHDGPYAEEHAKAVREQEEEW